MRVIAEKRRRFGCPRIQVMLEREGWKVNHKKVERLYKEEGLALRRRRHRKKAVGLRVPLLVASRPNQHWAMDFVQDRLASGRKFRALTIEDTFSRESPAIEVDTSLGGIRVVRVLDRLAQERGLPEAITVDNGTEFDSKAVDAWAFKHGVKIDFIHPGKPNENAYIESFNGRFREECLNEHIFETLDEAREIIEEWRIDYNNERPHSSLENLTPTEFVKQHYAMLNCAAVTATASVE